MMQDKVELGEKRLPRRLEMLVVRDDPKTIGK